MKTIYSLTDIAAIAKEIIAKTSNKTLLFEGEMGAGKTTLIKALAKELGIADVTASPTYGFVNVYESTDGTVINHFDFYRLNSDEEAYDIGIEEYFYENNWNFIEWPSKAMAVLPDSYTIITLEKINETQRTISIYEEKII